MRHRMKTGVVVLVIMFFMNQVCFADPSALLDWRKDMPSLGDTLAMGSWRAEAPCSECPPKSVSRKPAGNSINLTDLHKYLGFSAAGLVALAAVTNSSKGIHYGAAYGATLAAAGAVTTGYMEYQNRFTPEDGLYSRDNAHIILGTLGALGCLASIFMADSDGGGGHAGAGIFGGAAMAASIITIKW
ncbi:MAG: hypothetical protein AB1724_09255 [Thermodesulfobacteriota bacterium]